MILMKVSIKVCYLIFRQMQKQLCSSNHLSYLNHNFFRNRVFAKAVARCLVPDPLPFLVGQAMDLLVGYISMLLDYLFPSNNTSGL